NGTCGEAFWLTVGSAIEVKSRLHGTAPAVIWIVFVEVSVPFDAVTLTVACPVAPLGVKVSVRLLEVPLTAAVPRPEVLAATVILVGSVWSSVTVKGRVKVAFTGTVWLLNPLMTGGRL